MPKFCETMIYSTWRQVWKEKTRLIWLFIELTLVFVVAWLLIDPLFVKVYEREIELGYNPDDIVVLNIEILKDHQLNYDIERSSGDDLIKDLERLARRLKHHSMVEGVAIHNHFFFNNDCNTLREVKYPQDSVGHMAYIVPYVPGWDYFKVMGLEDISTCELIKEPKEMGVVLSHDLLEILNDEIGEDKKDHYLEYFSFKSNRYSSYKITSISRNIKYFHDKQPVPTVFRPVNLGDKTFMSIIENAHISLRIQEGRTAQFLQDYKDEIMSDYTFGNISIAEVTPMDSFINDRSQFNTYQSDKELFLFMLLFLLIVVFIGAISTFWLRTEQSKLEVGIRKALGATNHMILKKFMAETTAITIFTASIGLGIVSGILYFKGLYQNSFYESPEGWLVNNEIAHYLVVTILTFLILYAVVLVAAIIPVLQSCKNKPIESLREE